MKLNVSIVTYAPDLSLLKKTVVSLRTALTNSPSIRGHLVVIDNGPEGYANTLCDLVRDCDMEADILSGQGNVGYGRGHNLGIEVGDSDFHLILNPDVVLAPDALAQALAFMTANPDCGLLSPRSADEHGQQQYLCKRYPGVLDLLLRGFAPAWLKHFFRHRLGRYEMRDCTHDQVFWDPPIVSGCFMLFRMPVLKALGGFDQRYFLYFEDFDLSLRAGVVSRLAYVPAVRITHYGGNAARKGWRHVLMFARSALIFFRSHGCRQPSPVAHHD